MARQMSFDAATMRAPGAMLDRLQDMAVWGVIACGAFASAIIVAVMLSNIAVGGWVNSSKPLVPDISRINPLKGFGRLFTKDKLADVGKILVIVIVLSIISVSYLGMTIQPVASLIMQPSMAALKYTADWLATGVGLMLVLMLVVAAIDVPLQKILHKSRLKMSHQEFKQEHKESDGNPHVKGRLRQRQRELSQSGSVSAVPKADFVVMNPTHFAVAIRYDEKHHGRAPGHLQGCRSAGDAHPRSGAQPRDPGAAVADAGARPVRQRRDRPGHSFEPVHRGGAGAGLCIPSQGCAARRGADAGRPARARRSGRT